MKVPTYQHDLGNGSVLTAYSIDSEIGKEDLEKCVNDSLLTTRNKSPVDLKQLSRTIQSLGSYEDFEGLQLQPSFDKYEMPIQLHDHRDAIQLEHSNSRIIYRNGNVSVPGEVIKGEYRDFVSTHLNRVPAEVAPEKYPNGKTIAELLPEWNLSNDVVAKYLGFAHLMKPSNGKEFSFVYRNKNMPMAADCMALSGSTPPFPEQFNQKGFSFNEYFRNHLAEEMEEEYCLNKEEFNIGGIRLMNDVNELPFALVEITTPLSTRQLADKAYDQPQPKKEHSIFFSTDKNGLRAVLEQFDVYWNSLMSLHLLL